MDEAIHPGGRKDGGGKMGERNILFYLQPQWV
jgi:hypothetical protein